MNDGGEIYISSQFANILTNSESHSKTLQMDDLK
jgi:hypothetical protein